MNKTLRTILIAISVGVTMVTVFALAIQLGRIQFALGEKYPLSYLESELDACEDANPGSQCRIEVRAVPIKKKEQMQPPRTDFKQPTLPTASYCKTLSLKARAFWKDKSPSYTLPLGELCH